MCRKWLLLVLVLAGVALCPVVGWGAASDRAALAKQAERMCIRREFAEAEQIYAGLLDGAADADERFGIRRKLAAVLAAQDDKQSLAKATVEGMLSDYADHARLPHAIHEIAESCHKFGKAKRATEIYAEILGEQPGRADAIWLVMGQAIADTFAGDEDGAWANIDKLLNDYPDDSRAAESVGQVAWCCRKIKDWENARTLYRHVVDNWPDNERAIYSQRGVILASLELKERNVAEAAVAKLFADYSEHEGFVAIVSNVASGYRNARQLKRARELHQYIVDAHPGSDQAIWSQREVVVHSIYLGDDPNLEGGIDRLLRDFGSNPNIGKAAYQVARKLNYGRRAKAKELYEIVRDKGGRFGALAKVNIGRLTLRGGNPNGARAIFDEVLAEHGSDPGLPEVVNLMAEAYWEQAAVERGKKLEEGYKANLRCALTEWNRIVQELPEMEYHTAAACFFSGECLRLLGDLGAAIERYENLAEKWPDFQYSPRAMFTICLCTEKLLEANEVTSSEGVEVIREVCQRIVDEHADSSYAGTARSMLKRYQSSNPERAAMILTILEGREQHAK